MFGFTDWFSSIATYVMSWYEKFDDISDGDSEEEWGQFVVIDEEKSKIAYLNRKEFVF